MRTPIEIEYMHFVVLLIKICHLRTCHPNPSQMYNICLSANVYLNAQEWGYK